MSARHGGSGKHLRVAWAHMQVDLQADGLAVKTAPSMCAEGSACFEKQTVLEALMLHMPTFAHVSMGAGVHHGAQVLNQGQRNASQNDQHSFRQCPRQHWWGKMMCRTAGVHGWDEMFLPSWWRLVGGVARLSIAEAVRAAKCVLSEQKCLRATPHFANEVVDSRMPRAQPPRAHWRCGFALGRSFATSDRCRSRLAEVDHRST